MKTSDQMQKPADAPGDVSPTALSVRMSFPFPVIWSMETANEVISDIFRSAHELIKFLQLLTGLSWMI